MIKKLLIQFYVLIGFFGTNVLFAQTLVEYNFNNVSSWNIPNILDSGVAPAPTLKYWRPNGSGRVEITPGLNNSRLEALENNDYIELTINTKGYAGLNISFDWSLNGRGLFGGATWRVESNNNGGTNFSNIGSASGFIWLLGPNDSGSFSQPITGNTDVNNPLVIRITASDWAIFASTTFSIDNIKITYGNPNIGIYTGGVTTNVPSGFTFTANTRIDHLSQASYSFNSIFPVTTVGTTSQISNFRIRNVSGSAPLTIDRIVIEGENPFDFVVADTNTINPIPSAGVNASTVYYSRNFTVAFRPTSDGIRTAEVTIYSNGPTNPYKFTVKGIGASCNLENALFAKNDIIFGGANTLEGDFGSSDVIYGKANNSTQNNFNLSLYPTGDFNLYNSENGVVNDLAWFQNGTTEKEVTFGGTAGIDISMLKDVSIEFKVAAFTKSNDTRSNPTTRSANGLNNSAYVTLGVSKNGGPFVNQITLRGSNSNDRYYRYAFGGTNVNSNENYNSNRSSVREISNSGNSGSDAYNIIRLNIPSGESVNNLRFRIIAKSNSNDKIWVIDDVKVLSRTAISKTWNGTRWSPSGRPLANEKAIFTGNYDFTKSGETADLSICECEITNGAILTIPSNKTLTVKGKITNNGTEDKLNVNNDGNLIQTEDDAVNNALATIYRNSLMKRLDYTYWSSPVTGQQLKSFSPGTLNARFMEYKEEDDLFHAVPDVYTNFEIGKGYAIRAFNNYTQETLFPGVFKGEINNGRIGIGLGHTPPITTPNSTHIVSGYNVVGNPYPSNIDFDVLYRENSDNIEGVAYFWTNVNATPTQQEGTKYNGNNYAIYNLTGGNPATRPAGVGSATPDGIIKVGQGFMVQAKGPNKTLLFSNQVRVKDQGHFFPKARMKSNAKDRYWLSLVGPAQMENTFLAGYIEGATDDFELAYDARISVNGDDAIYSILGDDQLVIMGKQAPFKIDDRVVIGVNHFQDGEYTISLANREGIFSTEQSIYLHDLKTGIVTDLTKGDYMYLGEKGIFDNRFVIEYRLNETLNVMDHSKKNIQVYRERENFVIKNNDGIIKNVEVFDMVGRTILFKNGNTSTLILEAQDWVNGIYLLKITDGNQVYVKKVKK